MHVLLPQYFANRRKDVQSIAEALDRGGSVDWDLIATLAHNMHGSGASFGFPEITALGEELERAAREKHEGEARALLESLRAVVDCAQPG